MTLLGCKVTQPRPSRPCRVDSPWHPPLVPLPLWASVFATVSHRFALFLGIALSPLRVMAPGGLPR